MMIFQVNHVSWLFQRTSLKTDEVAACLDHFFLNNIKIVIIVNAGWPAKNRHQISCHSLSICYYVCLTI